MQRLVMNIGLHTGQEIKIVALISLMWTATTSPTSSGIPFGSSDLPKIFLSFSLSFISLSVSACLYLLSLSLREREREKERERERRREREREKKKKKKEKHRSVRQAQQVMKCANWSCRWTLSSLPLPPPHLPTPLSYRKHPVLVTACKHNYTDMSTSVHSTCISFWKFQHTGQRRSQTSMKVHTLYVGFCRSCIYLRASEGASRADVVSVWLSVWREALRGSYFPSSKIFMFFFVFFCRRLGGFMRDIKYCEDYRVFKMS